MALIIDGTLTADGDLTDAEGNDTFTWKPIRKEAPLRGTIFVYGDFGSGTLTANVSPDGGTTFIAIPDATGADTAFTSDGVVNFELYGSGDPIKENSVKLQFTLAGSTDPDLNVRVFDIT